MEEIKLSGTLIRKLNNLVTILYEKEYFGFMDSCNAYVDGVYDFIYTIPDHQRKVARNPKYGKYYCTYKHNKNTTWYITFDVEGDSYFVQNIFNNHTIDYPDFIQHIQ